MLLGPLLAVSLEFEYSTSFDLLLIMIMMSLQSIPQGGLKRLSVKACVKASLRKYSDSRQLAFCM